MSQYASTSIDQLLIEIIKQNDPQLTNSLIKSVLKTIPTKKKRRKSMSKIDSNLNNIFKIKRINYSIRAKIHNAPEDNMYQAEILSVVEGKCPFGIGENLPISKRELQTTGRKEINK